MQLSVLGRLTCYDARLSGKKCAYPLKSPSHGGL